MKLGFKSSAISDVGLQRDGNEDSALISPVLIAVADGMGGHAAGEVASKVAIDALTGLSKVLLDSEMDADSKEDLLLGVIQEIDDELAIRTKSHPEYSGMGTTLTSLFLNGSDAELLHVGDSRCYFIKKDKVEQLSHDHTVMQELLDQGRLTPEEVADHPQRSLLTQVLMGEAAIHPMLLVREVKAGDRFLLCSDGLSSVISELEINKIIKAGGDLISNLLVAVRDAGAPDNVTIILSEVVDINSATELSRFGAASV
jgi:serine/threonine protein phosphatase PrpC